MQWKTSPAKKVSVSHLRGSDECCAHEYGEGGEADGIVLLVALRAAAGMRREGGAVVQRDAHEEHSQPPAQRAEHALVTVPIQHNTLYDKTGQLCGTVCKATKYS